MVCIYAYVFAILVFLDDVCLTAIYNWQDGQADVAVFCFPGKLALHNACGRELHRDPMPRPLVQTCPSNIFITKTLSHTISINMDYPTISVNSFRTPSGGGIRFSVAR